MVGTTGLGRQHGSGGMWTAQGLKKETNCSTLFHNKMFSFHRFSSSKHTIPYPIFPLVCILWAWRFPRAESLQVLGAPALEIEVALCWSLPESTGHKETGLGTQCLDQAWGGAASWEHEGPRLHRLAWCQSWSGFFSQRKYPEEEERET